MNNYCFNRFESLISDAGLSGAVYLDDALVYINNLDADIDGCTRLLPGPRAVCIVVRSGQVGLRVNDIDYEVERGNVFLVQQGDTIDAYEPAEGSVGCMLLGTSNRMLDLIGEVDLYRFMLMLRINPVVKIPSSNIDNFDKLIDVIASKLSTLPVAQHTRNGCIHILHALMVEAFDAMAAMENWDDTKPMSRAETIYRDFTMLLATLAVHPRDVEWYAKELCVSARYLSAVCRQLSGRPASAWIRDYAMVDIRRNLKKSSLTIKDVARLLGYSDLSFFGKCVRRWFGMSPTELRTQLC